MRWAGHVARMLKERKVYKVLEGKPEGKRPLGRPRHRWEYGVSSPDHPGIKYWDTTEAEESILCEVSSSRCGEYEAQSSGMYCRVLNCMSTDVSEVRAASIIRAMSEPSAKGSLVKWESSEPG
jgi:hypothetical protein